MKNQKKSARKIKKTEKISWKKTVTKTIVFKAFKP